MCQYFFRQRELIKNASVKRKYGHTVFPQNVARRDLFQSPVRCGDNLRVASTDIDKHVTLTIPIVAHLYVWILHVHICI